MKTRENIYRFADTLDNKVPLASDTVSLNLYKDGEEVSVKDLPGGVTVHIARVGVCSTRNPKPHYEHSEHTL